jgi:multidrug efflux pump subunit AcrB
MNLAVWLGRHRRSVLLLAAALTLGGIAAAVSLPIGLFPQTSFPRVRVNIDTGSQPADQMMLQVTQPMEQAVRAVPGVQDVTSITSRGAAQLTIDFGWGADMSAATLGVNAAMAQLLPSLPPGASYNVLRMDPTVFPIIAYALTSPHVSQVALRNFGLNQMVPLLSAIPGVARIQVQGGDTAEIQVQVDPHELAAFHLTLDDVERATAAANALRSVGRLEDHDLLYLLVETNAPTGLMDVKNIVVRGDATGVVRLADVATVSDGVAPKFFAVADAGHEAVTLLVFQQPDGNAVAIAAAVQQALAGFAPHIPPGVRLSKWYDQSTLVLAAAASVRDAIIIGVILAAVVLMVFLRSLRMTLLALLIVPASLAGAVLVLSILRMSFNIMTLGGLAAAVGLVIDDVIVMIEHIVRRTGGAARSAGDAAILQAGAEFLRPLTGASAATLIVFAPLGFLSGVTGAFFKALAITMASTLVISWLLAAFAVPLLAGKLIDFSRLHPPGADAESWMARTHRSLLEQVFKRPILLGLAVVALLILGGLSFSKVQTGFMPHMDEGGFVLDYQAAPGTSLTETVREVSQIEAIVQADPAVQNVSRRTGAGLGGDLNEANHGDVFIQLKAGPRAPIDVVMQRISDKITARVPGIDFDTAPLMGDLIGDLTGVPQPIEIKLSAVDPSLLAPAANRIAAAIGKIQGVDAVVDGIVPAGDAYDIHIDPVRAAMHGLDPATVAASLNTELSGSVVTQLTGTLQETGIRVQLAPAARQNTDDLAAVPIATPAGPLVPLGSIASFSIDAGQPEITRENLQQIVAVTGRISGRGIGNVITDVRSALAKPGVLGAGVTYTLGGLYQQQQIAFAGLLRVFLAALVAVFGLLLFLYERFLLAGVILLTALLSTMAVFTGLYLTNIQLNITAMMGMTMIVGIATEMAIFYVSEYLSLLPMMPPREALIAASANRLRPITMTTLAAIMTLLPLALDLGRGAGMQQPLAIAIISGLLVQFPLVLLALPVAIWLIRPRTDGAPAQPQPKGSNP